MSLIISGTGPLREAWSVAFGPGGSGELEAGPVPPRGVWSIQRMTVSTNGTGNPMPTCYVYDGPPNEVNLLDATWTGSQDANDTPHLMRDGEFLTVRWTGGTAGEIGTFRLTGHSQLL